MSMFESMSGGGHYRKHASPAQIKKMKEGNKRADRIRAHRESEHSEVEVPTADALLDAHLQSYEAKLSTDLPTPIHREPMTKRTWWERVRAFFTLSK